MNKDLMEKWEQINKQWVSIAKEYEAIGKEYAFIVDSWLEQAGDDDD